MDKPKTNKGRMLFEDDCSDCGKTVITSLEATEQRIYRNQNEIWIRCENCGHINLVKKSDYRASKSTNE